MNDKAKIVFWKGTRQVHSFEASWDYWQYVDQVIVDGEVYRYDPSKVKNYEFHFTSSGESAIVVQTFSELDSYKFL